MGRELLQARFHHSTCQPSGARRHYGILLALSDVGRNYYYSPPMALIHLDRRASQAGPAHSHSISHQVTCTPSTLPWRGKWLGLLIWRRWQDGYGRQPRGVQPERHPGPGWIFNLPTPSIYQESGTGLLNSVSRWCRPTRSRATSLTAHLSRPTLLEQMIPNDKLSKTIWSERCFQATRLSADDPAG